MEQKTFDHPNLFEYDGVWYGITAPPKTGSRSLRDIFRSKIKPSNQVNTGQLAQEHAPDYTKIFEEFGGRPERFEVILLVRHPYHRLRSIWRNWRLNIQANSKYTFAEWLLRSKPLEQVLYSIRYEGKKIRKPYGYDNMWEYMEHYVMPHNPDVVHRVRLEHRAEDWVKIGFPELPMDDEWKGYRSSPDGMDDVEYFTKNPEIAFVAEIITKLDMKEFGYDFEDMTEGYGVSNDFAPDPVHMKRWYDEHYEWRFRYFN